MNQETKICSSCGVEKLLYEFAKDKSSKCGYCYRCKKCRNKKRRDNFNLDLNKTTQLCIKCKIEKSLDCFDVDIRTKLKISNCCKQCNSLKYMCNISNPILKKCNRCGIEKLTTDDNFYKNKDNPGGFQAICKECHNKLVVNFRKSDTGKEQRFKNDVKNKEKLLLSAAKTRAKKYGLEFDITIEDIGTIPERCPVFEEIVLIRDNRGGYRDDSPTLDRIDNTKGYVKGNVIIISMRANQIKNSGNANEHRKIADYIDKYTLNVTTH